jgi:D-alanyl-D-alanine carboxypeptidase
LPIPTGWFYSNTNNILAALIIEKASGLTYKDALEQMIFEPVGLNETFYFEGPTPDAVVDRMPRGLYENAECLLYQPTPCQVSVLAPLIGQDMRTSNLSWAGAAGAIISTPHDLAKWIRALFGGRVIPQQQLDEMMTLVSQATGKNITDVSKGDPFGFGLDIIRAFRPDLGDRFWYYEGTTLGYRAIFAYWPLLNLVMTVTTNSQPPEGEDQLGDQILGGVFKTLADAKIINTPPPPGPPDLPPANRD